ncbi:MAG: fructosamine kinase family protein [Bacteroidales bacterium]|nr:fructosamine kinase family protein [Bacteroidales bacterium]
MNHIKRHIEEVIQEKVIDFPLHSGKIKTQSGKIFFLKSGHESAIYQCEANGLQELAKAQSIRISKVISVGENYILTQFIEPSRPASGFFERLGRHLAKLHRYTYENYGFYENNFIGLNPQFNVPSKSEKDNWIEFYLNKRLLVQFHLAEKNGFVSQQLRKDFNSLENKIEDLLQNSLEPPSLLHGDLWSGNFLCDSTNNPVLIDPAVYYGHREADLAMTKLFGGFPYSFYKSYQEEFPLKSGWEYREGIYKLYHVLNHLNLFGKSYLPETEYLIKQYL